MRAYIIILLIGMLVFLGCTAPVADVDQPADDIQDTGEHEVSGQVNLNEIGGEGLVVASSFWAEESPVAEDGTFTTFVSSKLSVKIEIKDAEGNLRGTVISLPENRDILILDAESTAKASLVSELDDQVTAEKNLQDAVNKPCYPELLNYLKTNLKTKSISEMGDEYRNIIRKCYSDSATTSTVERQGYVNLEEIGGDDLKVISAWADDAPVAPDGTFTTTVSGEGSQLVFLKSGDDVWATAISLPEDQELVFDVESTVKASLWVGGSMDQNEAEDQLERIESLPCYPNVYSYIEGKLQHTPLSNFSLGEEYMGIIIECFQEQPSEEEGMPSPPYEENESEEAEFEPITEEGCWEFGDISDPGSAGYIIYTKGNELVRWDDHCSSATEVVKKYCPTSGAIASTNSLECPTSTKCLDGACVSLDEYESGEICKDLEGSDKSVRLCEAHTFTHSSGISMTPDIILYSSGALQSMTLHLNGAEEESLGKGDFLVQEMHSDSGKTVFLRVIGAGKAQDDQREYVLLQIWTEGGINPAELENGKRVR